jgi:hypothetical protein
MATNTDEKAQAFLARLIRLEQERRDNATDRAELLVEMKAADLLKEEIAGIKLAVKRHFEEPEKRELRESAEQFAEALGEFAATPLGDAAIKHVRNSPTLVRATKKGARLVKEVRDMIDTARAMDPVLAEADAADHV